MADQAKPIYQKPTDLSRIETPFEGDSFGREALAERLTSLVLRMPDGGVMAIDAPWGEGKSWFGRHWRAQLVAGGFRCGYIDCFQRDHVEDPFGMIAGEFLEIAKAGEPKARRKLAEASKKVAMALVPAVTKLAANSAGHILLGNAEAGSEIAKAISSATESASKSLEELVSKSLVAHEEEKKTVDGFKKALAEVASERETPVVVFVDELDRCRPDFAVRSIERVKHFFEVPGVVFVLLLNQRQLTAAVRGLYGPDIDADAYLGKFIQVSMSLPKRRSADDQPDDDNVIHCGNMLERYGFGNSGVAQSFAEAMGFLASELQMSLRDVERAAVLLACSQPFAAPLDFLAWPIALKLGRPELFRGLVANNAQAHGEAADLALSLLGRPRHAGPLAEFEGLHRAGLNGFQDPLPDGPAKALFRGDGMSRPRYFLTRLFDRIDVPIA